LRGHEIVFVFVAVARKVGSNYWYLDNMYWEAFEEKADIRALRSLKPIED
jgi:hypothetical protein